MDILEKVNRSFLIRLLTRAIQSVIEIECEKCNFEFFSHNFEKFISIVFDAFVFIFLELYFLIQF